VGKIQQRWLFGAIKSLLKKADFLPDFWRNIPRGLKAALIELHVRHG
jgi:hypothetical protein